MTNRVPKLINNKYIDQTYERFTTNNTSGRLFLKYGTFSMTYKYAHNSFFQHPLK